MQIQDTNTNTNHQLITTQPQPAGKENLRSKLSQVK